MTKGISSQRRTAHYLGLLLIGIGVVLFFATIVGMASDSPGARPELGMVGLVLVVIGGAVQAVGAAGLAGSGVVLDPERARRDLEPFSRMAGGMAKDALEEAGVSLGQQPVRVVMVKCAACGHLNEEGSKFCQECGRSM